MALNELKRKGVDTFPCVPDDVSTAEAARRLTTTPPTIRGLLASGELSGRKVARGTRFAWLIDEASVERYRRRHGPFSRRKRASSPTLLEVAAEVRALREAFERDPARLGGTASTQRERDDLRAKVVTLEDALARTRAAVDLQLRADAERATMVEHLLAAASAGERADSSRRAALAEFHEAAGAAAQAGHLGNLGAEREPS